MTGEFTTERVTAALMLPYLVADNDQSLYDHWRETSRRQIEG